MNEATSSPGSAGGPLDRVLERLQNVRQQNGGFKASCPAPGHGKGRGDLDPSLSIGRGDDGRVLLKCHAGCTKAEILDAMGLPDRDLFEKPAGNGYKANGHHSPKKKRRGKIIETYDYTDQAGKLLFQGLRYEQPKDFSQRRPDGAGGWIYEGVFKNGTRPVLYRLPKVLAAVREGRPVWDVEGEKDVHRMEEEGLTATTNPMGAGKWPDHLSEALAGADVRILPDNDAPGRDHALKVARALHGKAASVKIVELRGVPEDGGDVSDWFAAGGTAEKLEELAAQAPEWKPTGEEEEARPEGLKGRILLGELLRGGIEPTPQLIPGLIYEARIHSIASGPGTGKTLTALWKTIQVMKQGRAVLYIDAENGPKLIAERLQELGADLEDLDELFHYYPAEVSLDRESLTRLMATVEQAGPALVVFDSFADLLSIAGLEENSNDDCTRWMRTVAQPIKDAGVAVLILDHVPKGGKGPRGGGSKRAKVDVQWNLEVTQPFDRERTGEIELKHDKDREAWLPKIVRFSVGGGVFARSAGTIEDEDGATELTDLQREVYAYIKKRDAEGANWGDILSSTSGSKGSLSSTLKKLVRLNLVEKDNGRYYVNRVEPEKPINKPDSQGSVRFSRGSVEPTEPGDTVGVQYGSPPLGGEPTEPDAEPDGEGDDFDRRALEALRHGNGPRKALSSHKANGVPFEQVVRSVMHYLGRRHDSVDDWEPSVMRAAAVLGRGDDVEVL